MIVILLTWTAAAEDENDNDEEEGGEDGGEDLNEGVVLGNLGALGLHAAHPASASLRVTGGQLLLDCVNIHHTGGRVPGGDNQARHHD